MTAIVIPYTFVAGTTARANEVNDNYTAVTAVVNGNIDNSNISASAAIALSKLALTTELFILRATGNRNVSAGITGDTVPRASLTSDGWVAWGPGSASAMDTMIKRTAASQLSLRNFADSAYADFLCRDLTGSGAGAFTGNLSGAKITASGTILAGTTVETLSGICGFRLSVATGDPVGSGSASGSLYLVPYGPNAGRISFYDGTNWQAKYYASQATLSVSMTSGLPYDIFAYDNAGTLTLDAVAWTNTTTRATALAQVNGIYCKNAANSRLYVGTVYASGSNQVTDSVLIRGIYNFYNQIPRYMSRQETTDTWTYTSNTLRQANNSTSNQLGVMTGLVGTGVDITVLAVFLGNSAAVDYGGCGIGIDSTTVNSATLNGLGSSYNVGAPVFGFARLVTLPALGYHTYVWLENTYRTTNTSTFAGDAGASGYIVPLQSGITGWCFQ